MKLTQITVSYGETQSLPEYSNVKPSLTLTATLDEGDDPAQAEAYLWQLAKDSVHIQVDAALEANDKPAKYSSEPRYQVLMTYFDRYNRPKDAPEPAKIVVILPNGMELDRRPDVSFVSPSYLETRKLRYAHALRIATETARERGADLLDCADGDMSPLEVALAVQPQPDHDDLLVAEAERSNDSEF